MQGTPRGDVYINIGTEKSCLFLRASVFLVRQLSEHPVLYFAVEEGLQCAKEGYFAAGILALSQLLNLMKKPTPGARHRVAHDLLSSRPSKGDYERITEEVKEAARGMYELELARATDATQYRQDLLGAWDKLMQGLRGEIGNP